MITERAFKLQTQHNFMTVKHLLQYQGLPANIYYPISEPSLYNDSSQLYDYNEFPDESGRYLFTGIFTLQEFNGLELEGYTTFTDGDAKMYVVGENLEFPRNSKVEIFFEDSIKVFRTQDVNVVKGLNGIPLYGIHNLVPVA